MKFWYVLCLALALAPFAQAETEAVLTPTELDARLNKELAAKAALFLAIRESALDLKPLYQQLFLAGDAARQRVLLEQLADPKQIPTTKDLKGLFTSLQQQLDALGSVSIIQAPVYEPSGQAIDKDVLRLGGFSFIAEGRYLVYSPEIDRLVELPRQPASSLLNLARRFQQAHADTLAPVALDPSGGQTLQLLVQIPNLQERIAQGGIVGCLILILAGFAYVLCGYRFVDLGLVGKRIKQQLQTTDLRLDNPLGRVLAKLEQETATDEEALYLTVEEALTGERIKLERALAFLKLVAAIAPMLGLLGTVTGMIETFQAIALHGSGDPKLMSGGISQALVTTVLGLVAAIPILLFHSLLLGRCQNLGNLLDAHVAAALALRLEQRHDAE
ncbi:MotA/TolQ/ExbB proton channel family protein [Methylotuvimicrobium sp. KM2]|uniref:MotA/TolQ/ExbB proton channel family protein n=1 Tax=Methylotuvimicrobium sp. KM2 TaxID=3133976 RepID=UPI00310164F5